ncbi:MAG TPA: hypothetical protein VIC05_00885 [Solirubrobacteraceae bacterium]|jgi:hypothetical protein
MSKRLQVVVDDETAAQYERTARAAGLTVSQWARQAMSAAQRESSGGDIDAKLSAIRRATVHAFPEVDIDTMLAEIEAGYGRSETR